MTKTEIFVVVVTLATIGLIVGLSMSTQNDWIKYRADHSCYAVEKVSNDHMVWVGHILIIIPGKTKWKCDGQEIIR